MFLNLPGRNKDKIVVVLLPPILAVDNMDVLCIISMATLLAIL